MCHGEFGIDLDGALEERYGRGDVPEDTFTFMPVL